MLALIATFTASRLDGDDTGTYADGAIPMPMIELRPENGADRGRREFQRDYGQQRRITPDAVGFA
ncbi:hypothetical protein J5J10_09675 [Ciceribacter sp. L1K23]|uniref:hypothetical protein n=1 Tax=Ciceribacter sp. L1K23 TaxID=2820276 RepID=UPI001B819B87|nr:hypothetical protein [Ciceribacter sp. L1K23]MBR0555946.1 hypothetical protein [Ciceribacter sp. L1K23]